MMTGNRIDKMANKLHPARRFNHWLLVPAALMLPAIAAGASGQTTPQPKGTPAQVDGNTIAAPRHAQDPTSKPQDPKIAAARKESQQRGGKLLAQLKTNPKDANYAARLVMLYVVDLDQPTEAAKYTEAAGNPSLRDNVSLAVKAVESLLAATAAATVGLEWVDPDTSTARP